MLAYMLLPRNTESRDDKLPLSIVGDAPSKLLQNPTPQGRHKKMIAKIKNFPPDSLSVTGGLFSCLSKDNLLLGVKLAEFNA